MGKSSGNNISALVKIRQRGGRAGAGNSWGKRTAVRRLRSRTALKYDEVCGVSGESCWHLSAVPLLELMALPFFARLLRRRIPKLLPAPAPPPLCRPVSRSIVRVVPSTVIATSFSHCVQWSYRSRRSLAAQRAAYNYRLLCVVRSFNYFL